MRVAKIVILVLLLSCGQQKRGSSSAENFIRLGSAISAPRQLNDSELSLVVEVCNSFKFKRLNFPSTLMGHLFKFKSEEHVCENTTTQMSAIVAQLVGDQFLTADPGNFSKNLETDTNGLLSTMCASVFSSVIPSNSELLDINSIRQFSFDKNNETTIMVTALYGKKTGEAKVFTSYKSDQMLVTYISTTSPSWRGMVTERKTMEVCPVGSAMGEKSLYTKFLL